MIWPAKTDGSSIAVYTSTDGRVYVDAGTHNGRPASERMLQVNRGGPFTEKHFHRFEDYGLREGLLRCRKCGLVKEP